MRIEIILLGKTRNAHLRALIEDYRRQISYFSPIHVAEWKTTDGGPWTIAEARGKSNTALLVLLDAAGRAFSSEEFAHWLARQQASGRSRLVFLLGGAEGFLEETKREADLLLSLSPMTLPHELARVVLVEQIYRAFAFLREHPYPK